MSLKAAALRVQAEERLREANARLSRQLGEAKARTGDLVAAVERALADAATGLRFPPTKAPKLTYAQGEEERALVVVSDLQLAKTTPTYGTAVAEQRMALYGDKIARITALQRSDHPVREARVWLLGDIVEGELIFSHQPHQIDASLYRQVAVDGPRIVCDFLRRMLGLYERVHVVGVIGNHGRLGESYKSRYNPETNADRMLYRFCADLLASEKRLTWNIPYERNERAWYAVDYPFGKNGPGFLLFHGDQIRGGGFAGFPFYGTAKRIWGWRSGAVREPFNYAVFGHWHTMTKITLNDVVVWCNGTLESTNTYAAEQLAACGCPTQLLMFCHPRKGVTAEYACRLD